MGSAVCRSIVDSPESASVTGKAGQAGVRWWFSLASDLGGFLSMKPKLMLICIACLLCSLQVRCMFAASQEE